ncbi:NUDIX domain-containing protein [Nonomuraea sp. B1E8]|uniref:NUDIX domain-containing protein n=1 Tax=unclassified Nonomuraea TaxID=2593643 RepID=UPI00325F3D32
MRWLVHSETSLHSDEWLDLRIADVELPDGRRLDHRLVRTAPGAGVVVTDGHDRVLLIWRHRFITDTWGWEIPLGRIDEGEMPIAAAAREAEEETGWRPGPLRPLLSVQPFNGLSDSLHHVYRAESATRVGPPADPSEATRVEWLHLSLVRGLIADGEMVCGTSVAALLYLLVEHTPHGGAARPPAEPAHDPGRRLLLPDLPDLF